MLHRTEKLIETVFVGYQLDGQGIPDTKSFYLSTLKECFPPESANPKIREL